MLWRMIYRSWGRNPRRKALAVVTVFLAASLISALLAVSIDIGDKMAREMKAYGANILLEPAGQAALPEMFGARRHPLASDDFLDEAELANIKDIFWRNNIVGFAPMLAGEARVGQRSVAILGTFFNQPLAIPDEEGYRTGQRTVSPFWQVNGEWPQEPAGALAQTLVGQALARRTGWQAGDRLILEAEGRKIALQVSGILSSGGAEDNQLVMPLGVVQRLLGLAGKVQAIHVSALTVPENDLSRRARENPDALDAEEYDRWYCTAYVSSIAHQLAEAISGAEVHPVWQVAASEGVVIGKIQLLMVVVTLAALAAAGMGIASLMTSAIMERAGEIGLMKALGARQGQILLLFYLEAALDGLAGGALGCVAGWGLAKAIGLMLFAVPLHFAWVVVPCVLVVAVLIALVGSWLPARRIARLDPVEVLYGR